MIAFKSLNDVERSKLIASLRGNEDKAIIMDRRDTSFVGSSKSDEVPDEEVINAIKSVPCHY